jgi:hypothetical protein
MTLPQRRRTICRVRTPFERPLICPPTNQLQQSFADQTRACSKNGAKISTWQPPPSDSLLLSSQRITAPCARPARRKMTSIQAGLLARGFSPFPAFPDLVPKAQWQRGEELAADSCGGSSGFASPHTAKSHRIPFWPVDVTDTPERRRLDGLGWFLSMRQKWIAFNNMLRDANGPHSADHIRRQ